MWGKTGLSILSAFFCIAHISMASEIKASVAVYGERCNDSSVIQCDESKFLVCRNQICTCLNPEAMTFDALKGSCVTSLGKVCHQEVPAKIQTSSTSAYSDGYWKIHWQMSDPTLIKKQTPCGTNAWCDESSRVCKCQNPADLGVNGICRLPKVPYSVIQPGRHFKKCFTNANCNASLHLICINQTCLCDPLVAKTVEVPLIYNYWGDLDLHYKCVGKANKPCINYECTENAACIKEPIPSKKGEYSLVCRCLSTNYLTVQSPETGTCSEYGKSCNYKKDKCPANLKCIDGICQCTYPRHQFYKEGRCWSAVRGPCNVSSEGQRLNCVAPAKCEFNGVSSRCVCPENQVENSDGTCSLGFGHSCETRNHVSSEKDIIAFVSHEMCDKRGFLRCVEGTCQCPDMLHVYDETEKKCMGLVGAHCTIGNVTNEQMSAELSCVLDAYCAPKIGNQQEGFCKCKQGMMETANGTCKKIKSTLETIGIAVACILPAVLLIGLVIFLICKYFSRDILEFFHNIKDFKRNNKPTKCRMSSSNNTLVFEL